jgi:AraC-like DNA-binding protein
MAKQFSSSEDPVLINPSSTLLGMCNAILTGTSTRYVVPNFAGPLSLKWMPTGWGVWETKEGRYRVDAACYLVLNHGQEYALTIDLNEPRESFCPFFARGFVEQAQWSLTTSPDVQLDDPQRQQATALYFPERLYEGDAWVTPQLRRMRDVWRAEQATNSWLEEEFHQLADRLLWVRALQERRIASVPAARSGTRVEIARRLHRARDFMHAHFDEALPLTAIARVACLSPHHFHRLFCGFFGHTPHHYLTTLRIERAKNLLRYTEMPVTQICLEAGFESLGSFSSLFRREVGVSPACFREKRLPN